MEVNIMFSFDEVQAYDPELAEAMKKEFGRQEDHIELIASENFVSKAVMAAMGRPLNRDIMAVVSLLILQKT